MNDPALKLNQINRSFVRGYKSLTVLQDINLEIYPQQIVALLGASGVGKSTLLHIAGLLEVPTSGEVIIGGREVSRLTDRERTQIRLNQLGFIYQYHHLQPEFSALENVCIPQLIKGLSPREAYSHAKRLLAELGLEQRIFHRPAELSGGEQQRVAIARAIVNKPRVLLADEPTGNLDPETSERVFKNLLNIVKTHNVSALIATHNHELAKRMDRVLVIEGRKIKEL